MGYSCLIGRCEWLVYWLGPGPTVLPYVIYWPQIGEVHKAGRISQEPVGTREGGLKWSCVHICTRPIAHRKRVQQPFPALLVALYSLHCPICFSLPNISPYFLQIALYFQQNHQINKLTLQQITKSPGAHRLPSPKIPGGYCYSQGVFLQLPHIWMHLGRFSCKRVFWVGPILCFGLSGKLCEYTLIYIYLLPVTNKLEG